MRSLIVLGLIALSASACTLNASEPETLFSQVQCGWSPVSQEPWVLDGEIGECVTITPPDDDHAVAMADAGPCDVAEGSHQFLSGMAVSTWARTTGTGKGRAFTQVIGACR